MCCNFLHLQLPLELQLKLQLHYTCCTYNYNQNCNPNYVRHVFLHTRHATRTFWKSPPQLSAKCSAESVPKSNGRRGKTGVGMRLQATVCFSRQELTKISILPARNTWKKTTQWNYGEKTENVTSHVPKPQREPLLIHTGMTWMSIPPRAVFRVTGCLCRCTDINIMHCNVL